MYTLFMFFLIAGFAFYVGEFFNLGFFTERVEKHLFSIVIVSTSVITGSFFITKTYINSQISIKEKEMGRELREAAKEIIKEQRESLIVELDEKLDRKLINYKNEIIEALRS